MVHPEPHIYKTSDAFMPRRESRRRSGRQGSQAHHPRRAERRSFWNRLRRSLAALRLRRAPKPVLLLPAEAASRLRAESDDGAAAEVVTANAIPEPTLANAAAEPAAAEFEVAEAEAAAEPDDAAELEAAEAEAAAEPDDAAEFEVAEAGAAAEPAVTTPLVILIGPCLDLAHIQALVDGLEIEPVLEIDFRMFSGGMYRLDGRTTDLDALCRQLAQRSDVRSATVEGHSLHIVPQEPHPQAADPEAAATGRNP